MEFDADALATEAAAEIASYAITRRDQWFDDKRQLFYMEQTNPKCNSAVSQFFPVPKWIELKKSVEKDAIRILKATAKAGIKVAEAMGDTRGGHSYILHDWIERLCIAAHYGAMTSEQIQELVHSNLIQIFSNKRMPCELLIPIIDFWKLSEVIVFDANVSIVPGDLGTIKYISANRTHQSSLEFFPTFIPMTESTSLISIKSLVTQSESAKQAKSKETEEIIAQVEAAVALAFARRIHCPVICTSPASSCNGGSILNPMTEMKLSENFKIDQLQMQPVKDAWALLKGLPKGWLTSDNQVALAYQRFKTSLSEPDAEACLALVIALEALLNVDGSRDELKFRYSLMTGTALGSTPAKRKEIFEKVSAAYDIRSSAVHTAKKSKASSDLIADLKKYVQLLLKMALTEIAAGRGIKPWASSIKSHAISGETFPNPFFKLKNLRENAPECNS